MLFLYKVKLKSGEIMEGTMEGDDKFSVSRELKSKGNIPLSITLQQKSNFDPMAVLNAFFGGVKNSELVIITKNLASMLRAGLSLSRALSVLEKQTKKDTLKKIFGALIFEISSGGTLSAGLEKFPKVFSKLFVSMTRAGEESGNLDGSLTEVGSILEKSNNLTKKIKGALIYPSVIVSAMVIVGVLMFAFIVPTLAKTFKEMKVALPASTQVIMSLGDFFSENLLLSFIGIFVIGGLMYFLFTASFMQKYIDFIIIRLPMVGTMVKEINTARTARTMSSLLVAGVSITRAIEITEEVVQNIYYKKILNQAKIEIEKGSPFSKVFEENTALYPIMMSEMIQVGEETGKLVDMLTQVAMYYEEEVENKTKNLSTIIEPLLMVVVGGGVGFFAYSMITPLYSVLDNIK